MNSFLIGCKRIVITKSIYISKPDFRLTHISDKRLLIFRSSFRAVMAVTCPFPTRTFLDKLSDEAPWPRSGWKTDSITCTIKNKA